MLDHADARHLVEGAKRGHVAIIAYLDVALIAESGRRNPVAGKLDLLRVAGLQSI